MQSAAANRSSRRVLIAIDRSAHSERALRWYAEMLHRPGNSVILVNVTEPPELALGFGMAGVAVVEDYAEAIQRAVSAAKQLSDDSRELCRELGIGGEEEGVRFLERVARSPGPVIVTAAEDEAADLVVLGCRGVGLIRRTFLGSVSDYVLHHCHRPVLVVPPPNRHQHQQQEAGTEEQAE